MYQNISVNLPDDTLVEIDRLAPQGDRSRFIAKAVKFYLYEANKQSLRDRLKEGAICRAERDLNLAQEWFAVDEEVCLP
jgi:CopG family transcriptional regulator / antitoxin EndoAI